LDQHKELKSFIKTDREVDEYENVEVKFITGKPAILTIYENGVFREDVSLSNFFTKVKMHEMMIEKGFRRKPDDVIEKMRDERKALHEKQEERRENLDDQRMKSRMEHDVARYDGGERLSPQRYLRR